MLLELCRGLDRRFFQNLVVALKSGDESIKELEKIPVTVKVLNSGNNFWSGAADVPRIYSELKRILADFSPDIVHTWLTRANVIGRLAAKSSGISKVVSGLRVMETEKRYHLWAEFLTHRWSKVVTVNCTALEKFAVQKIGIPKEKIVLIFNGIEVPQRDFQPERKQNHGKDEFVIGTMGRLHRQKGMDIFLNAAKMALAQVPGCRFLIAGEGPEKEALQSLARKLNIQSKLEFSGWARNPYEFISMLDIFVLASRWEGMPNVILEAMALSKPILATRVGGITDLIEDGQEGLLIEAESVTACAAGMLRLIQDPSLRQKLGQLAQKKAIEKFSLQRMVSSYQALYESLAP